MEKSPIQRSPDSNQGDGGKKKEEKKFFTAENGEKFPIFKTIELTTKTGEEYLKELEKMGVEINIYVQKMLRRIEPLEKNKKKKLDLIFLSIKQLGFKDGATLKEIYNKAYILGLDVCPIQVAPEICLSYKDQPSKKDEYFNVGMDLIEGRDGQERVFHIGHDNYYNITELGYNPGSPDSKWDSIDKFIFVSRK